MRSKLSLLLVSLHFWRQKLMHSKLTIKCELTNCSINGKNTKTLSLTLSLCCFCFWYLDISILSIYGINIISLAKGKYRREDNHFDVHLWRIKSADFLSKDGKESSHEGKRGWKSCLSPDKDSISVLIFNIASTSPYLYFDLTCKQKCFPCIDTANESTEDTIQFYWCCKHLAFSENMTLEFSNYFKLLIGNSGLKLSLLNLLSFKNRSSEQ